MNKLRNKMEWWDKIAVDVQNMDIADEKNSITEYEDNEVKQAIVHARQDITLIAVHLSSANKQLSGIKGLLTLILVALVMIAIFIYH